MDNQHPADIPRELHHLIHLNIAYRVLICPDNKCRKAVKPGAFSEHLRVKHQTSLRDRERVQQYVDTFRWDYDFSTIPLPRDGSPPQPVIPVVDGSQCRTCPFKSSNRKTMRLHGNKEHKQQRMSDDELFTKVRLQSWFQDHRQRYWVVDEGEREDDRDTTIEIGEEEESAGSLGLRGDKGVVDASTEVEDDEVVEISVVEARDDIEGVVSDDTVIEAVGDDHEEVFSNFDDSEDADYEESSQGKVSDDEKGGSSSEVEVEESDDESFTVVGDDRNTVGCDKHPDRRGSHPGVEDDEGSDRNGSMAPVDEEEDEIRVRWHRRVRKRTVPFTFEDRRGTGIDSEDDISEPSSPGLRVQRGMKRQRRMSAFVDSGVVMASSQDDGVAPPSSPPARGWIVPRRSADVEERVVNTETIVERTGEDAGGDASSDAPFAPQHGPQYDGSDRSIFDLLRDRLEAWHRTCPACYLDRPGGARHIITDCVWRSTTAIIN